MKKSKVADLQRQIIDLALKNKFVGYPDVLFRCYGFRPAPTKKLVFTRHRHLRKEIHTASVSICKAFNRLAEKGLVQREIGGVRLK